jgi:hypothetical protein
MSLKPAYIRSCWPFVLDGLKEVKKLRGGTWRFEDVYADCVHKVAHLWLADEGFVIFRPEVDDYSGQKILLVWMAWGQSDDDLIDKYLPQIVDIAKSQEFDILRFYRHAKGPSDYKGFRKTHTVYDMDL